MVVQDIFLENPDPLFHFCEACIFPGHVLIHTTDVSGDDVSFRWWHFRPFPESVFRRGREGLCRCWACGEVYTQSLGKGPWSFSLAFWYLENHWLITIGKLTPLHLSLWSQRKTGIWYYHWTPGLSTCSHWLRHLDQNGSNQGRWV